MPRSRRTNRGDRERGILYRKKNLTVSSDINKKLLKKETWKCKTVVKEKLSAQLASVNVSLGNVIDMIDTFDRPGKAYAEGTYTRSREYEDAFEDKPGKRIPKCGFCAEAGVGRARAEYSIYEAEAKGPNASLGVGVSMVGAGVMARAELASASAKAGPLGVKVGLGLDTGGSIGLGGVEAKVLGIGFSIGPKTSISVLGSEASCAIM